jgi:hypothetical protein
MCTEPPFLAGTYLTSTIHLPFTITGVNMGAPLTTCTRAVCSDLIFMGWRCKRCGNSWRTIIAVQWQCFATVKCVQMEWHAQKQPHHSAYSSQRISTLNWTTVRVSSLVHMINEVVMSMLLVVKNEWRRSSYAAHQHASRHVAVRHDVCDMMQRKEHSWNEWDYSVRVMMLTSASCCRHVQQDSVCSFFSASRLRHQYSRNSTSVHYQHDIMSSTREDVIRRRHLLLMCADSSLNHEWSKTASFVSCLDACLDAVGVRPP